MPGSKRECIAALSDEEKASLVKLCGRPLNGDIPSDHIDKFLGLRLVEVNCGEIYPTSSGRSVLYAGES